MPRDGVEKIRRAGSSGTLANELATIEIEDASKREGRKLPAYSKQLKIAAKRKKANRE